MKKRVFSSLFAVVMIVMMAVTASAATTPPSVAGSNGSPAVNDTVTFTISSSNFGIAADVAASSNLTFVSGIGATAASATAFAQVGGSATIVYTYTVNAGSEGQAFWFEASNVLIADDTNPSESTPNLRVDGTVAAAPVAAQADISYATGAVAKTVGDGAFTNPLTITTGTAANVTYASSNTAVATVNAATGEVTIVAAGSATITASHAADASWLADAASYTLTVNAAGGGNGGGGNSGSSTSDSTPAATTTPTSPQTGVYN